MLDGLHWKLLGNGLVAVAARSRQFDWPSAAWCRSGSRPSSVRIDGCRAVEVHALRQHRDAGSFVGAHQGGLLQQLGQVAVERGVPADRGLERQAIDLRDWWQLRRSRTRPARASSDVPRVRRAVEAPGRTGN